MTPTAIVNEGAEILAPTLCSHGFSYRFLHESRGSGGHGAVGEYANAKRSLEFHFRYQLGIVTFKIGSSEVSFEGYLRHLGKWNECAFPRAVESPLDSFRDLAHDLQSHCADFLSGSASELIVAARREKQQLAERGKQDMIGYVGDRRAREEAKEHFRAKDWSKVVEKLSSLQYPEDLSAAESKKLQIALQRRSSG